METISLLGDNDLLGGVSELPAQIELRGLRGGGAVTLAACMAIVAMLLLLLLTTPAADRRMVFLIFLPIAPIALAVGIQAFASYRQYTFTREAVTYSGRGLLGRRKWQEPLSSYRGVLMSQRLEGRNGTIYLLTLKHRERRSRDILLFYEELTPLCIRERQEHCARLLGLPALTETADGLAERAPADLDKPVRQRVVEGSLPLRFDPASRPPGHGLSLSIEGDTLVLRSRMSPLWGLVYGPALLLGLAIPLSRPLGLHSLDSLPDGLSTVLFVVGGVVFAWHLLAREDLLVSPGEVRRQL